MKIVSSKNKQFLEVATKNTKIRLTILFETKYFLFEKKQVLVRFKPRAFAALGILVTFRLS